MSRINESKQYKVGKFVFCRAGDDWVARDESGKVLATFINGARARTFCMSANTRLVAGESLDALVASAEEAYEQGLHQRDQKIAKAAARAADAAKAAAAQPATEASSEDELVDAELAAS